MSIEIELKFLSYFKQYLKRNEKIKKKRDEFGEMKWLLIKAMKEKI
jgi:hypothetical protein